MTVVRDWHAEFDPDGEGTLCYACTEPDAQRQARHGFEIHRAVDCHRAPRQAH